MTLIRNLNFLAAELQRLRDLAFFCHNVFSTQSEDWRVICKWAPSFASIVFESCMSDLLLSIARFMDPSKTSKYPNYSIAAVLDLLKDTDEPAKMEIAASLQDAMELINAEYAKIKLIRDKVIAHNDASVSCLKGVDLADLQRCVDVITSVLEQVHISLLGITLVHHEACGQSAIEELKVVARRLSK